jgi:hypothetical protein
MKVITDNKEYLGTRLNDQGELVICFRYLTGIMRYRERDKWAGTREEDLVIEITPKMFKRRLSVMQEQGLNCQWEKRLYERLIG